MAFLTEEKFRFVSQALSADSFGVVSFEGSEGLSKCYEFEIMLVTDNAEIDLGSVVQNPAKFTIHRDKGDDVDFHGILESFEQLHEVDGYVFYRTVLVPKLWWLTLTHHNQVFLNKTVKDMLEDVLKDGGLTNLDYDFRLEGEYQKIEYVCQYGETHFNFMSRWLEREGIYYYFEQSDSGEKVVFTDTAISHTYSPHGESLHYSPPSDLEDEHRREMIQGFTCRYSSLPKEIKLRDYNYRKPSLEMTGSAVVDEKGRGQVYYYGEHFMTPEEGNRLAEIRAQELLCRKEEFVAESTVPYVIPGYTFDLQDHYRESFNQKYLTVQLTHEGSQTGYLVSGIMKGLSDRETSVFYRNHFSAIPASVQFRPPRTAEIPKIAGTLNGKIDGEGTGKYAELDDQGRYKVILPFDVSGREDGKASTWLRMAQPYAGSDHGMHFPLHKGTEVLLTFIGGNPDRPIVSSAVPNPETPSPVTSNDQTMSKITTGGGNKVHIEDNEGQQRILMQTPSANTWMRMGAPNDPEGAKWKPDFMKPKTDNFGISFVTDGLLDISAQAKNEIILGEETKSVVGIEMVNVVAGESHNVLGWAESLTIGLKTDFLFGGLIDVHLPSKWELSGTHTELKSLKTKIAANATKIIDNETAIGVNETKIRENKTAINSVSTAVEENATKIGANKTAIQENETKIGEAEDCIVENRTLITANKTSIGENKTAIRANETAIRENETKIAANKDLIVENQCEIIMANDQIAENSNEIAAIKEIL